MSNEQRATFAVDIQGNVQDWAGESRQAMEGLTQSISDDLDELKGMQAALRNLKTGGQAGTQTFRDLKDQIDAKKLNIGTTQKSIIELGGSFKRTADHVKSGGKGVGDAAKSLKGSVKGSGDSMVELLGALKSAPGALGSTTSSVVSLGSSLGAAGLAGAIGVAVAAYVALTAAVVAAGVATANYALKSADARRNELLELEGISKLPNWYGRVADKADHMQAAIDKVALKSALGRGKLFEYTKQLEAMGLRGGNLTKALRGMAIVGAAQGDEWAKVFAGQAAGAAMTGRSIDSLVARVESKLGGIAARRMLSLTVIQEKWKESLDGLFSGIKVEGFLGALKSTADLFSQGTVTGRAFKSILEAWLNPLFGSIDKGQPVLKSFFLGLTASALRVSILMLKARNAILDFTDSIKIGKFDALGMAFKAGKIAALGMVAAFVVVGATLGAVAAAAIWIETSIFRLAAFVPAVVMGLGSLAGKVAKWFPDAAKAAWDSVKAINPVELGKAIIDGIANGILGAGVRAVKSIKDLAIHMKQAFTGEWKIASPSKVSEGYMGNIADGTVVGGRKAAPRAAAAIAGLFSASSAAGADPLSPSRRMGFGGAPAAAAGLASVVIEQLIIQVMGGDAKAIAAEARPQILAMFEEILLELGGVRE